MSWLNIGASLASSALSSVGASKAARRQEQAAQAAAAKIDEAYQQGKQLQTPYYNAGTDALSQLTQRLPSLTAGYDPSRLTSEPGYQFGLQQGQRALEGSLAARGLTDSGAALKAAARYGTDYATTKLNDAFNRDRATRGDALSALMGVSGFGERAGTNMATQGLHAADQIAELIVGAGNARAANSIAQGNIWGSAINGTASKLGNTFGGNVKQAGGAGWGTGYGTGMGDFTSGGGMTNYLADGGRVEPVVGTRAPRRAGGGGGGMSRQAVLDALDAAWREVPTGREPGTVATLPADPVRNPRAIAEDRMRKAGAYADGGPVRRVPLTPEQRAAIDADTRRMADPTAGQSFGTNLLQGTGRGMASVLRTVGGERVARAWGLPEMGAEADRLDAPLLNTAGGAVGDVIGQGAALDVVPLVALERLARSAAPLDTGSERMQRLRYATGGAVRSKAPGRADTVKARLSGGEFVIDAATVAKLGEGNTEAGFQLLEELVQRVKAHRPDAG